MLLIFSVDTTEVSFTKQSWSTDIAFLFMADVEILGSRMVDISDIIFNLKIVKTHAEN